MQPGLVLRLPNASNKCKACCVCCLAFGYPSPRMCFHLLYIVQEELQKLQKQVETLTNELTDVTDELEANTLAAQVLSLSSCATFGLGCTCPSTFVVSHVAFLLLMHILLAVMSLVFNSVSPASASVVRSAEKGT